MNRIASFCGNSRISLNEKKTCKLIFGQVRQFTKETSPPLQLHNKNIPTTKHAKFLGVTFDQNLSFRKHINIIASKAKTRATLLYSIYNQKYGPSPTTMIRLFKIYVRPLLEYGHISTMTASKSAIQPWEVIQTTYIRYILKIPKISNKITLKLAYLPSIRNRLNKLSINWYKKYIYIYK